MPIVSYTTIGGGLLSKDKALLRRYYALELSTAGNKRTFFGRGVLRDLPDQSLLPAIGEAWGLLSDEVKADWQAAADVLGFIGYNLFVQDKAYRLANEIAGNATPSVYHQYLVGHLSIPAGAGTVKFRQQGNSSIVFPATLYLSRRTVLEEDLSRILLEDGNALLQETGDDLDRDGVGQYLKVRFKYTYDEGGGEVTQTDELSLDLAAAWGNETLIITEHTGLTGNWELEIEGFAIKGDFYFDEFYVTGAEGYITKDPHCQLIEKKWLMLSCPAGVVLETYYPA